MEGHQAAGLTVFGPMTVENLLQLPFFAAQLPQHTDPNANVCISIDGPSYCMDLDSFEKRSSADLDKCIIIVTDCNGNESLDDFHTEDDSTVASNAQDDDSDTDFGDDASDTEDEDELDSDDDEDIFTGSQ